VNFGLDEDERAVQSSFEQLIRRQLPLERVRAAEGGRLDRAVWHLLADAGVFSLRRPLSAGGAGLGAAAAAAVFMQLGRSLASGPLVASHLAMTLEPEVFGSDEPETGVVGGRVVGAIERRPTGLPRQVPHLEDLDELVVLDEDGVSVVSGTELAELVTLASELERHDLDPLTPVYRVGQLPPGRRIGGREDAAAWRANGAMLTAALQVGIAEETAARATAYALERQQFGRAIGSFQAVKHLIADMTVRAELARAATYAAAVILDDPTTGDAVRAGSGAKVLGGRAAFLNGKSCVQVMGGMGITWEMPAHLFLKRALVLEAQFGDSAVHEAGLSAGL
jgi:alkylation response protein AidB-like acyl-CoA dehydrogenase